MRVALIVCLVFALPAFGQKKVTVRPDGTTVVEDAPKAKAKAPYAPNCSQCGYACKCGPSCACDRPIVATSPPRPAVILPPVVYGEPVYLPPVRYAPMPVRAVPVVPLYAEPPRRKFTLFGLDLGPAKFKLAEAK